MNSIGIALGELCKLILPIHEKSYLGNKNSSIAICTLSSIDLLKKILDSEILNHISIVGRLLSENKGIDSIIRHVNKNQNIKTIIVCGKEVWGHKAGQSLFALHRNGIDSRGRINGSTSPDPILTVSKDEILYFQTHVTLVDMINEIDINVIKEKIF